MEQIKALTEHILAGFYWIWYLVWYGLNLPRHEHFPATGGWLNLKTITNLINGDLEVLPLAIVYPDPARILPSGQIAATIHQMGMD